MVDASMGEIMTTCEKIHWLISKGERWLKPEYRSCGRSMLHKTARVEFHPLGVVGAIVSWNYLFHNLFNPILAAVFSRNGIVVKVSENASWSGCFYVRILQTALAAVGAPENLVEVITRFAEKGEALVSCVDKMIFVGSPGVGRMIMRKAADTLIPVTLELGGKDPFIVCEDVDVPHMLTMRNGINLYSISVPPGLLQPQQLPYSRTGFNEGNEPPNMTRLNQEPHMNPMLNLPIQSTNQSQPSIPNLSHIMNQGPSFSFRPPLGPFKECLINSNVSDGTQLMNSEQKLVLPDNLNGGLHQK